MALTDVEREMLGPILARRPTVLHLQSGHRLDDVALATFGAARDILVSEPRKGNARGQAGSAGD